MGTPGNSQQRKAIRAGLVVDIIQKTDQHTGNRIRGTVQEILTNSDYHPHGIKVRLNDGRVGRVAEIIGPGTNEKDSPAGDRNEEPGQGKEILAVHGRGKQPGHTKL